MKVQIECLPAWLHPSQIVSIKGWNESIQKTAVSFEDLRPNECTIKQVVIVQCSNMASRFKNPFNKRLSKLSRQNVWATMKVASCAMYVAADRNWKFFSVRRKPTTPFACLILRYLITCSEHTLKDLQLIL